MIEGPSPLDEIPSFDWCCPAWTGAMSGASSGIGESCQFQNRVRSICSPEFDRPSVASPKMPPVGSITSRALPVPILTS